MDVNRCWQCGELYPRRIEFFRRRTNTSTGFSGNCRHCENATKRRLRARKKAEANKPAKPTAAERSKAFRLQQKRKRYLALIEGLR